LALHPEVQRRAQADIDLIAPNRLPTFDDMDSLPYIMAIIKESARWGPTVPLGLPHRVMEDDVYENYIIPKGATIFLNVWYVVYDSFLQTTSLDHFIIQGYRT
jgi:cytochrome P450